MRMPDRDDIWRRYKQAVLEKVGDFSVLFQGLAKQRPSTDGWVTALCPFHEDRNPSFAFNRNTGQWCCFAGCGKGSAFDYLMQTSGKSFKEALLELGDRVGVPRPYPNRPARPPIREALIKQWSANLWANEEVCRWLREKRGLSDATLKRYEIGWDPKRQRNTIPIRDERGNVVNVRLYNAKKDPKIINYTEGRYKYGSPARLFGLNDLVRYQGRQVILCEGEWDRLLLQQEGFMAVSGTHGASVFRPEWIPRFKDKDVVILYDCDREGQAAARNVVLRALKTSGARSVKNVVLPLKGEKDDKDVTDYLHKRGLTAGDLQKLIDETPPHSYEEEDRPEEVLDLESFTEIERKDLIDKKVRCEITVCGETSEAFHAVEAFRVTFCPRMQKGGCFECKGVMEPAVIPKGAQEYIGSCMSTNVQLKAMLREYACKYGQKPSIEILRRTTVKEFFCHQKVNRITQTRDEEGNVVQVIDGKKQELMEKRVYYLSSEHPKPGNYLAVGWVKSHPKTQQVTFLIESMEPQEDDFEGFRVEENAHHLRAFQSLSWPEILEDLTENVTRVYEREEILVAILLTYCSPRWVPFNDEIIRGWLVTVIIGDSGSGKTQTHQRIAEFINIGDCFSGLTGSRTGLAYALVEHKQKGWQVRIGRYPANSRKILTVDEAQHLPDWDLRTISKAMEEGFLQIDRVQSKGYESQTRLIMIANPKKDLVMDSFSFGCESLTTILPPTIIRRTDIAVFANSGDLKDLSFINRRRTEGTRRKITPEMLRAVVYWVWNLRPEQIIFTSDAEDACLRRAQEMSEVYGYAVDVPLITLSDCRNNLARVAAAFAALLVSADEHFARLVIEPKHVRMAAEFLDRLYSHENCALDDYSEICRHGSQLLDYDQIEKAFLQKWEKQRFAHDEEERNQFPRLLFILRITRVIRRDDLAEQVGCSVETVKRSVRLLKRFNLLDTTRDGYVKKPKFNKFLRRFLKAHPEFFAAAAWGGGQPLNGDNALNIKELDE
jgi:5S rRNA maturation endonuclease (ribonuclease M5)